MVKSIGLYLHIPFCRGKCPYCDFYSMRADTACMDTYTQALQKSMVQWAERVGRAADTLYLGGGTPSLLGGARIEALVQTARDCYGLRGAEVTVECNPSDADGRLFEMLAQAGVNRISLGLQSAGDEERKALGRRAGVKEAAESIRLARAVGIPNLSLDLMLGIPGQTAESLRRSIDFCVQAGVRHISAYLLKIEEGTLFARRRASLALPEEDAVCDLYEQACESLEAAGFRQYEISNFARPGFESRHNLKYWNAEEYLGLGASAHSFLEGKRFFYLRDLPAFLRGEEPIQDGEGGSFEEYAMLRMRLAGGLQEGAVRQRYGCGIPPKMRESARRMEKYGLVSQDGDGIRLTRKGFLLSNTVIAELLYPASGTAG